MGSVIEQSARHYTVVIRGLDPCIHHPRDSNRWIARSLGAKTRGACHRAAPCADPLALWPGNDDEGPALTTLQTSVGPGEGDLVERLGAELLRGARDHAAAEGAVELG